MVEASAIRPAKSFVVDTVFNLHGSCMGMPKKLEERLRKIVGISINLSYIVQSGGRLLTLLPLLF